MATPHISGVLGVVGPSKRLARLVKKIKVIGEPHCNDFL